MPYQEDRNTDLTDEQRDFIKLLQNKAKDTPVPLAVYPDFIRQKLDRKKPKRPLFWKVLSPAAMALTVCFAFVLAGKGNLWETVGKPLPTVPSGIVTSSDPVSKEESSDSESQPSEDISTPNGENSQTSNDPEVSKVPDDQTRTPESKPAGVTSDQGTEEKPESNPTLVTPPPAKEPDTESSELPPPDNGPPDASNVDQSLPSYMPRGDEEVDTDSYNDIFDAVQSYSGPRPSTRANGQVLGAAGTQYTPRKNDAFFAQHDSYGYTANKVKSTVTVLKMSGNDSKRITELPVHFTVPEEPGLTAMEPVIVDAYSSNGFLIVVGTADYKSDVKSATATHTVTLTSIYSLENPETPKRISSISIDGSYAHVKLVGNYLYLFSWYYPDSNAPEVYPEKYVPGYAINGEKALIPAEDVTISSYADCRYLAGISISLKDPGELFDAVAVLGGGKESYILENSIYVAGVSGSGQNTHTNLAHINFNKGYLEYTGEAMLNGTISPLFYPESVDGLLRVVTSCYGTTNYSDLYLLDTRMNVVGSVEKMAEGQILRAIVSEGNKVYFSVYQDEKALSMVDLTHPKSPVVVSRPDRVIETPTATAKLMRNQLYFYGGNGDGSIKLAAVTNSGSAHETVLTGEALFTPAIYDSRALLLDHKGSLVGFGYSENRTGKNFAGYRLYRYSATDGFTQLVDFHSEKGILYSQAVVSNNVLYLVSSDNMQVINLQSGEVVRQITF